MLWQRHLGDAILEAERQSKDPTEDSRELKEHRHLLHVIGDSLVYTLLTSHTIRTLSKGKTRPASLIGQGTDFEFVLDVAELFQRKGYVPIICDLTTLMNVGDIVAWRKDDLAIAECKNTSSPKQNRTSGRLARQRKRGEFAEEYLRESVKSEPEGTTVVATPTALPMPDWNLVQRLLNDCENSESGISAVTLGENDRLIASATSVADPSHVMRYTPDLSTCSLPMFSVYGELIDFPDYIARPPSCYPVTALQRSKLLEREIALFRVTDMINLDSDFFCDGEGIALRTVRRDDLYAVEVISEVTEDLSFTPSLIDWCIWNPIPLSEMRKCLVDCASLLVRRARDAGSKEFELPIATGDNVLYGTVYKDIVADDT